jgi:hypothetical protein
MQPDEDDSYSRRRTLSTDWFIELKVMSLRLRKLVIIMNKPNEPNQALQR